MSATHFLTLARRMWNVRDELDAAMSEDLRLALQRRHDRLLALVLSYEKEVES